MSDEYELYQRIPGGSGPGTATGLSGQDSHFGVPAGGPAAGMQRVFTGRLVHMAMSENRAPCAACGDNIPTDASACPNCANNPVRTAIVSAAVILTVGLLLTTLVPALGFVVAIVGVAVLFSSWVGGLSPTEYDL